jgi:oligosaccharide translocation protein RFT1
VGDKVAMAWLMLDNQDKGAYRLVSDLGSLVARIVFQPLEEISRAYFSKSLTNNPTPQTSHKETKLIFRILIRLQVFLGIYFVFFAPNFTRVLLNLLYQKDNVEAASLLSIFCIYVPMMGINGISEAFFQAVAPTKNLASQTAYLIVLWIGYICSSYFFHYLGLGAIGILYSNMINMIFRIVYSQSFIFTYYQNTECSFHGWSELFPQNAWLWSISLVCYFITFNSVQLGIINHVLIGVGCFLLHSASVYKMEEHGFIPELIYAKSLMKSHSTKQ